MAVAIWAGRYIGLEFKERGRDRRGFDCWGLVRHVLYQEFKVFAPSFDTCYRDTEDLDAISRKINAESVTWRKVADGDERAGDVILMRMKGRPTHVGIVCGDSRMLHIERGIDSCIEDYRRPFWTRRILGFYRHESLS